MTLWTIFAALLIIALGFVVLPLYRHSKKLTPAIASVIVATVGISAGIYYAIGQPGVPSGRAVSPDVNAMVASLAERLQREPNDVDGWLMLARSYETLEQYGPAADAYEKVLELQPSHPQALFVGGYIAAGRGEMSLAADRWQAILSVGGAPEDVRETMQKQIDVWRGSATGSPGISEVTEEQGGVIVEASVTLSDAASAAIPADSTVFLVARDPEQPSPPIAVARRKLTELPLVVSLSDREAMVPGRNLSAYPDFELVARISLSGGPIAQTGDWFGSLMFNSETTARVEIVIDQQVP